MIELRKLHKSDMMNYLTCPRWFRYSFVEQRKVSKSVVIAETGKDVHYYASQFFKLANWYELSKLKSLREVKKYFKKLIIPDVNKMVHDLIVNFTEFEAEHYWRVRNLGPQFFYPQYSELYVESDKLAGTIDRIDLMADGKLMIVEYKTGGHRQKSMMRKELAFYLKLFNESGVDERKAEYIGVLYIADRTFEWEHVHPRTLLALEKTLKKVFDAIDKGDDFPPRPGPMCTYCPYLEMCLKEGGFKI